MSSPAMRAFYLTSSVEPIYALFHPPRLPAASTSVLLCPLFGNDDLCAYRARREWARVLSDAGYPTLRLDLPGTGDSAGGPMDPGRVEAWTEALNTAASWLSGEAGAPRVTAIGIGLAGMLACRAAAERGQIDDLVLWSVPARGRMLVRQLRALSQMEASSAIGASSKPAPKQDGTLAIAGFTISPETVNAVETLDLSQLQLACGAQRRVLLLERDGVEVDSRLRSTFEQSGAAVTVANGPGYGAMVTPPQQSDPPLEVFKTVENWLAEGSPAARSKAAPAGASGRHAQGESGPGRSAATPPHRRQSAPCLEMTIDGALIRETPITVEHAHGSLFGVLAEPDVDVPAPVCAVLLNAGALRHIGPGRMWVELARRWTAKGVPTLRIDLAGIGDADGDLESLRQDEGFYVSSFVRETLTVLDALASRGMPEQFVLAGLCSGAYWSLQAALQDQRVRAAYMVNPRALVWDWHIVPVRRARKLVSAGAWQRFMRGEMAAWRVRDAAYSVGVAVRTLPTRSLANRQTGRGSDQLELQLEQLERRGVELLGVFTAEEPLLGELERDGRLERMMQRRNVRIERIPGPLASHTLEPLPLQRAVHRVLDRALDRQLLATHSQLEVGANGARFRAGDPVPQMRPSPR